MTSRTPDFAGGLPRSYLRHCLLLLLADGDAHGYDLLEQLPEVGMERADAAGVYRGLRAMEQEGLVRSWWEDSPSGPSRRTYALTDEGLDWLHAAAGALRDTHRRLGAYLQRYEERVERPAPDRVR